MILLVFKAISFTCGVYFDVTLKNKFYFSGPADYAALFHSVLQPVQSMCVVGDSNEKKRKRGVSMPRVI